MRLLRPALRLTLFGLVAVSAASAQLQTYVRVNFWCEQGNQTISVLGYTSSPTTPVQASYPNSTVTVYLTGTGGTKATIYSNTTGTALANPFTCGGSNGLGFFYAADGNYDINISGAGVPSQFTVGAEPAVNPFVTQPGGVDTPISQFFTDFPVSDQYATLSAALGNIQPGGSITIVGTYPLSAGITVATNNIRIQCQPGTLLEPMAANLNGLLIFTGVNQQIDGCGFDSNGNTGTTFITDPSATSLSVTNNSFADTTGTALGIVGGTPAATYQAGTVSVTHGSTTVTGTGTTWTSAFTTFSGLFFGGSFPYYGTFGANAVIQAASTNSLVLSAPWTGPTLTNSTYAIIYESAAPNTGLTTTGNTFKGLRTNTEVFNMDQVDIEGEKGENNTGDCDFMNILLNSFPSGATYTYNGNSCINNNPTNTLAVAMLEYAGNGIARFSFQNNYLSSSSTPASGLLSGGSDISGGPFDQLVSNIVAHNTAYQTGNLVAFNGGNYCIETYGHGMLIDGNYCNGHWLAGIIFDGYDDKIINNHLEGIGNNSTTNPSFGIIANLSFASLGYIPNNNISINSNVFDKNTCVNDQGGCILAGAGVGGNTITSNYDYRSPGAYPTDNVTIDQSFSNQGAAPSLISGNFAILTPATNGFTLPGGFTWGCFSNQNEAYASGPQVWSYNKCLNQNPTQFGQFFYGGNEKFFNGSKMTGNVAQNLTAIGGLVNLGLTPANMQVSMNTSLGSYSTGTVTIAALSSAVSCAGCSWTPAMNGGTFVAYDGSVAAFTYVSATSGTINPQFNGFGGSGLSYQIISPVNAVIDFTVIPLQPPPLPVCVYGNGSGNTGACASITGTPFSGTVEVVTAGSPATQQNLFGLTVPVGQFNTVPNCTIAQGNDGTNFPSAASALVSYSPTESSTTTLWFLSGSSGLAAGRPFIFEFSCQ